MSSKSRRRFRRAVPLASCAALSIGFLLATAGVEKASASGSGATVVGSTEWQVAAAARADRGRLFGSGTPKGPLLSEPFESGTWLSPRNGVQGRRGGRLFGLQHPEGLQADEPVGIEWRR